MDKQNPGTFNSNQSNRDLRDSTPSNVSGQSGATNYSQTEKLRQRYMEAKTKMKALNTFVAPQLEFPPGWEIPDGAEFQQKYQKIEFGRDID